MRITRKRLIGTGAIAAALVSAGIGVSVAASSAPTHTLSFKSVQLTAHSVSNTRFVNTSKNVQHGKFIGNTIVDGRYDANTQTSAVSVAIALKGGLIYARADVANNGVTTHGKVTGGTGKYKGISGTLTRTSAGKKGSSNITITYH